MQGSSADVYEQVHAIFGAFLAGIIVPREGGLAIALTEKLEDMVSIIFLPLVSASLPVMCLHAISDDVCSTLHSRDCRPTWVCSITVRPSLTIHAAHILNVLTIGITWGFTVAICALAYFGKFTGCTVAARFAGFSWREAGTIGSLMSCKG